MRLDGVDILNFKNISSATLGFSPGVNCLLGQNGMGKSNLLEAIHFLCTARGMSTVPEAGLVRHGEQMFLIKGAFRRESGTSEEVSCGYVKGKGKSVKLNGKEYDRISDHLGRFPVVAVTPRDSELVWGSGEERRRFMDMVISQADKGYLASLIRYRHALESRNRLLRSGMSDPLLFESVEQSLVESAHAVHEGRSLWVREISPAFRDYYTRISGDREKASVSYRSCLDNASMAELLRETRQKDMALGYTSRGVHRDDLETGLDDWSMRRLGSQGQVKTFTVALRLAVFDYLKWTGGLTPLLLLDDIFDRLDSDRVGRIMEVVSTADGFGQIFITDTDRNHLDEIISAISGDRKLLEVSEGSFSEIGPT